MITLRSSDKSFANDCSMNWIIAKISEGFVVYFTAIGSCVDRYHLLQCMQVEDRRVFLSSKEDRNVLSTAARNSFIVRIQFLLRDYAVATRHEI